MSEFSEQLGMNELDIAEENEYIKDMADIEAERMNDWWFHIDLYEGTKHE